MNPIDKKAKVFEAMFLLETTIFKSEIEKLLAHQIHEIGKMITTTNFMNRSFDEDLLKVTKQIMEVVSNISYNIKAPANLGNAIYYIHEYLVGR